MPGSASNCMAWSPIRAAIGADLPWGGGQDFPPFLPLSLSLPALLPLAFAEFTEKFTVALIQIYFEWAIFFHQKEGDEAWAEAGGSRGRERG